MSGSKTHIYNLKLSFKTLQANCQRSSCKVHIFVKIQNQQRKLKQTVQMRKNIAVFNSDMIWQGISLKYDQISGTYMDYPIVVSIHYETSEQGSKANKLKVGQVLINLSKLLNTKTYRINSQYPLQKCYDPNAKLKLSIDLTQIEDSPNKWDEEAVTENHRVSTWKVSKIREKMNEEEKNLLQSKLYQYEDKIEKHRLDHADQIKRLTDQLERKQQKLVALLAQNSSLVQGVQGSQMQQEKYKTKISALQKDLLSLQQEFRSLKTKNQQLLRQVTVNRQEAQDANMNLQQLQDAKERKQQHYKQELQKYLQRYTESQRARNRIVFEMETKLKEQSAKKDDYYRDIVSKLESKIETILISSKEAAGRKEKQYLSSVQKCGSLEKQLRSARQQLNDAQQHNSELNKIVETLNSQIMKFQQRMKILESESEMSAYSNTNLQRQVQRMKMEVKTGIRNLEEYKFEVEMANKTIEEQDAMIVKLNRSMKMLQEREYYMEEKYEEELQIKSINQERITGSHNYYKTMSAKLEIKVKILEERAEETEAQLHIVERDKQKLLDQSKSTQRELFESTHQILLLQSQIKRLSETCLQLEEDCARKQETLGELQHKFESASMGHEHQVNGYMLTIKELDRKNQELTQKIMQIQNQWEQQFEMDSSEKNSLMERYEGEIEQLRRTENMLKAELGEKQQLLLQFESEAQLKKDKIRFLERDQAKKSLEIQKIIGQLEAQTKQALSFKTQANECRSQLNVCKGENNKLMKRILKQKESYTDIIKWIFDRNWDGSRQFIKFGGVQVQSDLISIINIGLERWYSYWEKTSRALQELREENERIVEQWERSKLETRYEQEYNSKQSHENIDLVTHTIQKFSSVPYVGFENQNDNSKIQQLKILNYQLEKDLKSKVLQIQELNEELFDERAKLREQADQIQKLRHQIDDLGQTLGKKTTLVNTLQAQMLDREALDLSGFASNFNNRSPTKNVDYKAEAETKFKQQKMIMELERKLEDLDRQNMLQKSKIQLLETKIKAANEKSITDSQKLNLLQKNFKEKQESLRKLSKMFEQNQKSLSLIEKQLQLVSSKLSKKQATVEELKNEIQQQRKIGEILTRQVQDWENKFSQKQKKMERESFESKKKLLETAEKLASEKMEKEKLNLQQVSQIAYLTTVAKESEGRIASLQSLVQKLKKENEALYQKYLELLNEKNEVEEQLKDLKMNETISKQNFEKALNELEQKLQSKQYELEEFKFCSESKIIELQRKLEEQDRILQF